MRTVHHSGGGGMSAQRKGVCAWGGVFLEGCLPKTHPCEQNDRQV